MGKKRRGGKASKRGNNSAVANSDGGAFQRTSTGIRYKDGTYVGELKGRKPHGKGRIKYGNGDVYDGEWKDGQKHGKGICSYPHIGFYEGEWKNDMQHGKGSIAFKDDGSVYVGEFAYGQMHGSGTRTWPTGNVYEGQWANGTAHGEGAHTLSKGEIYQGIWVDGKLVEEDVMDRCPPGDSVVGETSPLNVDTPNDDIAPDANRELLSGRKLRSQRSQLRRIEAVKKKCEYCGVDDHRYKLRVCSVCNLALYCSEACQRAARGSHRRICNIISELPPRDADQLILECGKEKLVDLDAGLRYGTKYMANLKHLSLNLQVMSNDGTAKLSPERLSSLLKSKKGALDSVFWLTNRYFGMATTAFDCVWKELHGLKQLRLEFIGFDDVRCVRDIIFHQKDTLEVLCLPHLQIDWHKAKCRRTIAQAVGSCKHLVRLELTGCELMDVELKGMLQDLPNLRILDLSRDTDNSHEFTDNTCGLIARKCPGLQELDLRNHNQLSMRGIRKIFEGCSHLISFYTSSLKLSCKDLQNLLGIAPQLICLTLADERHGFSEAEISEVIELTGGRVVLQFIAGIFEPPDSISAKAKETYEHRNDLLCYAWSKWNDPKVASVWDGCLR